MTSEGMLNVALMIRKYMSYLYPDATELPVTMSENDYAWTQVHIKARQEDLIPKKHAGLDDWPYFKECVLPIWKKQAIARINNAKRRRVEMPLTEFDDIMYELHNRETDYKIRLKQKQNSGVKKNRLHQVILYLQLSFKKLVKNILGNILQIIRRVKFMFDSKCAMNFTSFSF